MFFIAEQHGEVITMCSWCAKTYTTKFPGEIGDWQQQHRQFHEEGGKHGG